MANYTYGQYLKWIGVNFSAITEQDIADLDKYKGLVPVYENGKIIDFIAKENNLNVQI